MSSQYKRLKVDDTKCDTQCDIDIPHAAASEQKNKKVLRQLEHVLDLYNFLFISHFDIPNYPLNQKLRNFQQYLQELIADLSVAQPAK